MRKNNIFLSMIGLSAALHGLALIGVPGDRFRTQPPAKEAQLVQTLKIIKVGTRPPTNAPDTPQEKKVIEKTVETAPEVPPIEEVEETVSREEVREDGGHDEETREGEVGEGRATEGLPESKAEEDGTMTNREYEALLAYIKDFVDKNLVYPPMARRRNIEGVVGVHFEIESNGGLVAVMVDHSSGSSILDNAAVSLVKKMHPSENVTLNKTLALRVNIAYELTE
ncbi:MAG: TonB family protein [Treponema sp.]|jgi:TonB family protein|nr:TonB family protein [Treponema sp.]